jgi:hypothetical protein
MANLNDFRNKKLYLSMDDGTYYPLGAVHEITLVTDPICSGLRGTIEFDAFGTFRTASIPAPMANRRGVYITDVLFKPPATIVFWSDGSKTVVKATTNESFDKEKGLAMAIAKKFMGNKGNYYNTFKKWIGEEDET